MWLFSLKNSGKSLDTLNLQNKNHYTDVVWIFFWEKRNFKKSILST